MAYGNSKTPTKPKDNRRQKYFLEMRPEPKSHVMKVYMTDEQKAEFCRLFPKTMNADMMALFGISFSTLQRFKREFGLQKDREVILHKHAMQIKRICEKNGYYASMRGKRPSEQCYEGARKKRESGWHPITALKEKSPVRYRHLMKKRSEARKALMAKEKKRVEWGLSQHTDLHIVQCKFTRSQMSHRTNAKKRGYVLGRNEEYSGERFTMYYTKDTQRNSIFERNCIADGFDFKHMEYDTARI